MKKVNITSMNYVNYNNDKSDTNSRHNEYILC